MTGYLIFDEGEYKGVYEGKNIGKAVKKYVAENHYNGDKKPIQIELETMDFEKAVSTNSGIFATPKEPSALFRFRVG